MPQLVRIWHVRLVRHAKRLTGRDDVANDVMQEAWLSISRGLNGLDDPARFGPWAYRIVTRCSGLWIRKQQRRRQVEANWAHSQPTESPALESSGKADVVDTVRTALRQLPAEQLAILELRYVEGFGIDQIAVALGIAPGTVKSRLFHARQVLREHILKVSQ
ncbi:MAG TPA: sigma-70 family RNA polymerase sigma factor [Pirellulales bacterium]